jgi:4-hydroxy-3-polyprenylbenzoate decarboxylase
MQPANQEKSRRFVVGITGASGALYAERLLAAFATTSHHVDVVATTIGGEIFRSETGRTLERALEQFAIEGGSFRAWDPKDFYAPFASGSQLYDGMAVVPCSSGAMGRMAAGTSSDLLVRAADVFLKENRRLVLLLRESPLSEIHLHNMLTLRRAGAVIMPASPAFYSHPKDLVELADSMVQRVLDHLAVESRVFRRWRDGADRTSHAE